MPKPTRNGNVVKPIRPEEVVKVKGQNMPKEVIETFNEFIAKEWDGRRAFIFQDKIAKAIAKKLGVSTKVLFDNHWLDIEGIFEEAGWKVEYDKPGYNEDYEASFTFRQIEFED